MEMSLIQMISDVEGAVSREYVIIVKYKSWVVKVGFKY